MSDGLLTFNQLSLNWRQSWSISMKYLAVFPKAGHWLAGLLSISCLGKWATSQTQRLSWRRSFERQGPEEKSRPEFLTARQRSLQAVSALI